MPRAYVSSTAALILTSFLFAGEPASAQDVRWRHDYAAARREATETGRALLLNFGTEECVWCRKLDASTFRNPMVIKLLNDRFIPVKIDGNKEHRLTNTLGIEGFPTLVLATPEGKVIGRHSGFLDATQITALLNKAPPPPAFASKNSPPPPPPQPLEATAPVPSEAEKWRRFKSQIDADLLALYPEIAAALDR